MKKLLFTVLCILPYTLFAQANFNGNWKLNTDKTNFNNIETEKQGAVTSMAIKQSKDSLIMFRDFADGHSKTESYSFDGKLKSENLGNANRKTQKSTALKWNNEKDILTINAQYKVDDGRQWEYKRNEIWKLSPDGRILTIERSTVLPDRTESVTLVYDKQ